MRSVVMRALSLVLLIAAGTNPAAAQALIKDPGTIGYCLCQRQSLAALLDAVQAHQRDYDAGQKALASLDSELAARRPAVNVYNDADVQGYKELLQRHDDAAAAFANTTDTYNASVNRYNQARDDYNGRCGGVSFDQTMYNTVQANLSCPKP
jgi:hypothetical protein